MADENEDMKAKPLGTEDNGNAGGGGGTSGGKKTGRKTEASIFPSSKTQ